MASQGGGQLVTMQNRQSTRSAHRSQMHQRRMSRKNTRLEERASEGGETHALQSLAAEAGRTSPRSWTRRRAHPAATAAPPAACPACRRSPSAAAAPRPSASCWAPLQTGRRRFDNVSSDLRRLRRPYCVRPAKCWAICITVRHPSRPQASSKPLIL